MLRKKPLLYRTPRLMQALTVKLSMPFAHRNFSWVRPVDSQRNKDDIEDWVKGSLHEPIPIQHFQSPLTNTVNGKENSKKCFDFNSTSFTFISKEEYMNKWHGRFSKADLESVKNVLQIARVDNRLFTMSQLLTLLRPLSLIRRDYEIHEIYVAYKEHIPLLSEQDTSANLHHEFLEIVLRTEDSLRNYDLCENLFSEYIRFPDVDPHIISIGLRSFIENDNLQLAKQFFMQALSSPETFPITRNEFHTFLRDVSRFNDLESMQLIFKLWISKKCSDSDDESTCNYPNFDTLSLLHKFYLLFDDRTGLEEFLGLEVVKKTGYEADILFQITEFCQNLHRSRKNVAVEDKDIADKINYFLPKLQERRRERRHFYLSILNASILRKDFKTIRHIISRVREDPEVRMCGSFHHIVGKYFVNQGLLNHLVQYYSDIVEDRTAGRIRLRVNHIEQLWTCALQCYPFLTKEITNELKVILNNDKYIREFPHLRHIIRESSKVTQRSIMGGDEYFKSSLSRLDFDRFQNFEKLLSNNDIAGATSTILESLKQGNKPQFNFYLCAIRKCLDSSLPTLAKLLNDLASKTSYKIPLKLSILWLRYDILLKYQSTISKSEMLSFRKVPMIESQLVEFQRTHRESLNFQNYLQLAQISIYIRDYDRAALLIKEASHLIERQSKEQWLMYYMTSLKVSARLYKAHDFHTLLMEWNDNSNAKLISRGCIRQIKGFTKLFSKRCEQVSGCNDEAIQGITKEVNRLIERYVSLKFEGLNESRKLGYLLKKWLSQEMKDISKHERRKRKALNSPTSINLSEKAS